MGANVIWSVKEVCARQFVDDAASPVSAFCVHNEGNEVSHGAARPPAFGAAIRIGHLDYRRRQVMNIEWSDTGDVDLVHYIAELGRKNWSN